jgi:hypothetical protein
LTGGSVASKVAHRREFKCLLTRAFATFYTSRVGSKVDREHAAGAAAKGTFATSRRLGNVKSSKVAKLILRSRLILRDTHRLDVCGTRLGSTDQALIMSLSSAGGMKIKIKKKSFVVAARNACFPVDLVLALYPRSRQST